MHVDHVSQQTAERRRQKVEDVRKRSEFRRAHGMDDGAFGGWTAKTDAEVMGPGMTEDGVGAVRAAVREGGTVGLPSRVERVVEATPDAYVDFEGRPQEVRKKWLGIW